MAALFTRFGAEKESILGEDSDEFTMDVNELIKMLED
jgi:hypothetical protein